MYSVGRRKALLVVRGSERIEYTYIEVGSSIATTPETVCCITEPDSIVGFCGVITEGFA